MPGEVYPVKIPICVSEAYKYDNALSESDALDLFNPELLWNAIGKKSLGRGRSLTHQSFYEDNLLLQLLKNINKTINKKRINITRKTYHKAIRISINLTQNFSPDLFKQKIGNHNPEDRIKHLTLSKIPWADTKGYFSYEKTFEAWLMENIDAGKCLQMWNLLGIKKPKIKWFANYLPFGVAGSNIDVVAVVETSKGFEVFVIELKNAVLNYASYEQVSLQVHSYAKFIKKAFSSFSPSKTTEIIPVILTAKSKEFPKDKCIVKDGMNILWLGYNIKDGQLIFNNHFVG